MQGQSCHNNLARRATFNKIERSILASVIKNGSTTRAPTPANANSLNFFSLLAKSAKDVGQARCSKPNRAGKYGSTWQCQFSVSASYALIIFLLLFLYTYSIAHTTPSQKFRPVDPHTGDYCTYEYTHPRSFAWTRTLVVGG